MRKFSEIIGKTTINPVLFYSGKICGYCVWIIFGFHLSTDLLTGGALPYEKLEISSLALLGIGLILTVISLENLGKSTRLGLPSEQTTLKTEGIYRISRNPMYLGFHLITLASITYIPNIFLIVMGIFSIIVYHLIVLGEESFLESRFGNDYLEYKRTVRRYI